MKTFTTVLEEIRCLIIASQGSADLGFQYGLAGLAHSMQTSNEKETQKITVAISRVLSSYTGWEFGKCNELARRIRDKYNTQIEA